MTSTAPAPTLTHIAETAKAKLDSAAWDYLMGATETETTMLRNRLALDSLGFKPRVLNDVLDVSCRSRTCGHPSRIPVSIAPMGSIDMLHGEGALPLAEAAEAFGVVSYLSSVTTPSLEAVAEQTGHPKVFQLYVRGDDRWLKDIIGRAEACGYVALCITADLAWYSRRERDLIKGIVPTARQRMNHSSREYQARLNWETIAKIRDMTTMPIMIKGINVAADARKAVDMGCCAVYISNHGGRGLDHGRAMIDALPEIVDAVGGRAEIIFDGGILRGTDVVKALCLGADTVGIGRLAGLALAAGGKSAAISMLELLENEIQTCMALLGVTALSELSKDFICPAAPVRDASATSALPFFTG